MERTSLAELRKLMITVLCGDVANPADIEELLASCWEELNRHDGGMTGYKLKGRMEEVKWNQPNLSFAIERHGGTVMGSGYAEIQSWTVNLESGCATLADRPRKRWLPSRQPDAQLRDVHDANC